MLPQFHVTLTVRRVSSNYRRLLKTVLSACHCVEFDSTVFRSSLVKLVK